MRVFAAFILVAIDREKYIYTAENSFYIDSNGNGKKIPSRLKSDSRKSEWPRLVSLSVGKNVFVSRTLPRLLMDDHKIC